MDNKVTISDFAKLTKSTLKTILYYHKIGLLKEPKRSDGDIACMELRNLHG
ncbi:MerR family transcriptional regulator [Aminipila terrae]|uniref:MerR family transcriptional regulator n=1 Tax=Aminipila terrae TaxID=2697030 RepID=UPI001FAC4590|nr:MerR family DNA-binding transcriptional regulator [Aminipila terrae]